MIEVKNKMLVRSAKIVDIGQLIELRKLLLNQGDGHYVSTTPDEQLAWESSYRGWLRTNLDNNPNINVAVCSESLKKEKIVGCAIGIIDERVPFRGCLNGKMGWVQTMIVSPNFRRRGLADQLMSYLSRWFLENNVEKIALQSTEMAVSFYKRLGFYDSGEPLLIR